MLYNVLCEVGTLFTLLLIAVITVSGNSGFFYAIRASIKTFIAAIIVISTILIGYSHQDTAQLNSRIAACFMPAQGYINKEHSVFFKDYDGHFYINANLNSQTIRFMVDTGASDMIIGIQDAQRIGIDPTLLAFDKLFYTANGDVSMAKTRISRLHIGTTYLENVDIMVSSSDVEIPLMGMRILKNFHVSINNNTLVLSKTINPSAQLLTGTFN